MHQISTERKYAKFSSKKWSTQVWARESKNRTTEQNQNQNKALKPRHLAESMSKSGTGNTGSNNDNVGVGVVGFTFSIGDSSTYYAVLTRSGIGSSPAIPPQNSDKESNRNYKTEHGSQDPGKGAVIHHHFLVPETATTQRSPQSRRFGYADWSLRKGRCRRMDTSHQSSKY